MCENSVEWSRDAVEIERVDEDAGVADLAAPAAAHEPAQLFLDGTAAPSRHLLEGPEATEIIVAAQEFFDGRCTERANQLILQIRDAHVEAEPFHLGAREVRAETGALERSPKDPLLACIVEAREPESMRWSTELGQEASDAVRASEPNDLDAGRREVDPAAPGQCFDRDLVAQAFNNHNRPHLDVIGARLHRRHPTLALPSSNSRVPLRFPESAFDFLVVAVRRFRLRRAWDGGSACPRLTLRKGAIAMKKLSVFVAAATIVALSVVVGATAGHAGVRGRSGTIAFLRSDAGLGRGSAGLFAIRPDGSGLRRLTPSGSDIGLFEWAPDGNRIAYLDRQGALRLVRPDGRGRVLLAASSPLRSPWSLSWSPDGKAIAVLARDPADGPPTPPNAVSDLRIYVVPIGGGAPRRLPSGDVIDFDWSPQGDEIVYADGAGRQRIIRTDGSKPRPFFPRPQSRGKGLPTWSPDGAHVGFIGFGGPVRRGRFVDRYAGIYVADADGNNLHLVTSHAYNEYGFAWSPDGRWILYGRANREGIYVIGADGRNNHKLTRHSPTPYGLPRLSWAPDGRSIAYETDRTGSGDIYLIGADGHNQVQLTSSPASDSVPAWQPR